MTPQTQPAGAGGGRSILSAASRLRLLLSPTRLARGRGWEARQREASELLPNIRRDLGGVGSATERVFLSVGERLMDLQVRAREIAGQTTAVASLMANDAGALAVLDEVLVAACASGQNHDLTVDIRDIQADAKSIQQAIQAIRPVVKTFDVLGMMTRIESARFESAGTTFVGLAEAVAALSRQIREETGRTADSATILVATTAQATEQMRDMARRLEESLGPLTSQASGELVKIREHRGQVSQAVKLLGARFDAVSHAVGEVVTGLQAHDIVRQQIDHVLEALGRHESSGLNPSETARLQAAQLDNSRATFESSVNRIRHALAAIERNIAEMAEESARLLGLSGGSDAAFLSSVASDLAGILTILDSNRVSGHRLAEAAASVQQRVAEISETIAGVHAVGIEMQRIALNATIQAAQLGPAGGALEVVARAIQELARETEAASDTLENRLRATTEAARALGNATASGCGREERIAHLRRSLEDFGAIQDQARGDYTRIVALTAGLTEQVRATIETFGTQHECLTVLAGAAQTLRGLSGGAPATRADGVGRTASKYAMPSRYTMQSERTVHETLYEARPGGEGCPEPGRQEDNIEFF
jgi:hypothetical protein